MRYAVSCSRMINMLLKDFVGLDSYVDDILASFSDWNGHLKVIVKLFQALRQPTYLSIHQSACLVLKI